MFYLVMIIYLWAGGLRAVAWADVFYGVLIFFGLLAGGFILISAAGGVDYTFSKLIAERPELILLPKHSPTAGISMWIGMFIIMPIGALMGPQMWIRMFATKEKKTLLYHAFSSQSGDHRLSRIYVRGQCSRIFKIRGNRDQRYDPAAAFIGICSGLAHGHCNVLRRRSLSFYCKFRYSCGFRIIEPEYL